ncbi:hypothetical protein VNO78_25063 [Psophocarpus tetragonolobus]|uniref:Uncharacterized protein n=1 Tax=Psophocarpus tetragonolobus TaxID=3891 RepID=A0AAN9S593_PSOTE
MCCGLEGKRRLCPWLGGVEGKRSCRSHERSEGAKRGRMVHVNIALIVLMYSLLQRDAQCQCMRAIGGWASCALSHSQSHHHTVSCHTTPHVSDILTSFFTAPTLICRPMMSFPSRALSLTALFSLLSSLFSLLSSLFSFTSPNIVKFLSPLFNICNSACLTHC